MIEYLKFWKLGKPVFNYLRKFFACPRRLDGHETRLKVLEESNCALMQTDKVTIAEISEGLNLATKAISLEEAHSNDYRNPNRRLALGEAYTYNKVLWHRLRDQKITPSPPFEIADQSHFRGILNAWREYLIKLKIEYKEPS